MSASKNKELACRIFEEFNTIKRNPASLKSWVDKYFAPEVVYHTSTGDMNREQYKPILIAWSAAFPDAMFTVNNVIVEGDTTVIQYVWKGTHQGQYMGIAPSGKQVTGTGAYIDRISGGKVVESMGLQDNYSFFVQLGAIPDIFAKK